MLRAKLFSEASGQVVLKLHGVSPQKIKKTKHRNLYNDRLMLKNNTCNQKHDFLNQFCQFFVMLYKINIIVQRSYINVLIKRLSKQSTGTYITTSQTSKNRDFCYYFSTLIDRCISSYALFS